MKIGIVTMYHQNTNYGGNLQAYALKEVINSFGYSCELLDYVDYPNMFMYHIKNFLINLYNKIRLLKNLNGIKCDSFTKDRIKCILKFNKSLQHSKTYCKKTINNANKIYDCFIAGSDQVWNVNWINDFYSLEFVDSNKYKFSYAASLGVNKLNDLQKDYFRKFLDKMNSVSVRETQSVSVLSELTDKKIENVIDPTLLLDKEEWDDISSQRIIKEPYVFCYLLGNGTRIRKIARKYADEHGVALVTIPFLNNSYRECDDGYGDIQLKKVSIGDFISIIKYADKIFTDSFHGTVFAHIFNKQFVAVNISISPTGVRIASLTELFGTSNYYFCDDDSFSYDKVLNLPPIDYSVVSDMFNKIRNKSLDYLRENIEKACNNGKNN